MQVCNLIEILVCKYSNCSKTKNKSIKKSGFENKISHHIQLMVAFVTTKMRNKVVQFRSSKFVMSSLAVYVRPSVVYLFVCLSVVRGISFDQRIHKIYLFCLNTDG